MRLVALALLFAAAVWAQPEAVRSSPESRRAFWGIRVVDAATGAIVYEHNADRFFVPASNTKLFTTSLALLRLGPDHRWHTTVAADAAPDTRGRVRELRLIGGGDPNLSARVVPYKRSTAPPSGNPLAAIEALADQVAARGVRVVDDVVGDDTAYVWDPYPPGWAIDDPVWEYGAPVSALALNDNAFTIFLEPSEPGSPATLSFSPQVEHLVVHNRTRTVEKGPGKLRYERTPGSSELTVAGTIALGEKRRAALLAVDDPALWAASAFREALRKRGINVTGTVRALHRAAGDTEPAPLGVELARHTSAPLADALTVVNKVSQNLHTEMLLREIARARNGIGSREGGLAEIAAFLKEIGVAEDEYRFEDASGLSRLTLVTPETIVKLLLHMHRSPMRAAFLASLPIGGADGTLYGRFESATEAANIRAKTGTISHVSSLSGYALRKDGRVYAFAILANNFNAPASAVRKAMDRIALGFLD